MTPLDYHRVAAEIATCDRVAVVTRAIFTSAVTVMIFKREQQWQSIEPWSITVAARRGSKTPTQIAYWCLDRFAPYDSIR